MRCTTALLTSEAETSIDYCTLEQQKQVQREGTLVHNSASLQLIFNGKRQA